MQKDFKDFYNECLKEYNEDFIPFRIVMDIGAGFYNNCKYHAYIGNKKGSFSIWTIKVYG